MLKTTTQEIKQYIKDELDIRKRHYIEAPTNIVEHYQNEIKNIEEYNGRQLFEMIQNADDASVNINEPKKAEVFVKLTDQKLIIANNGEQFSIGGIKSLICSDVSPKKFQANVVGNKGLGFRSILSWAEEIVIHSHDLNVGFSKSHAKHFLEELKENEPSLENRLKSESKAEYPIAILRCPNLENVNKNPFLEYDTVIEIVLKDGMVSNIEEQLTKLKDPEVLIFLNNIEKIIIDDRGALTEVSRCQYGNDKVKLFGNDDDDGVIYHVVKEKGKIEANDGTIKDYEIRIAFNNDLTVNSHKLYSFFQTEIPFPFPVLAHATFELTSDRKRLSSDTLGINKILQAKLARLMIKSSLRMAELRQKIDYFPLKVLSPIHDEFSAIEEFHKNFIVEIKKASIFPTIEDKFKSIENGVVAFLQKDYTRFFTIEQFPNLLKFTSDEVVINAMKIVGIEKPKFSQLENLFNTYEIIHEANVQANLIQSLSVDYKGKNLSKLKVFYNEKRKLISPESKTFLPPSNRTFTLPEGIIEIVNIDLNNELKNVFNAGLQDTLEERLNSYEIRAYRLSRLIDHIIEYFSTNETNSEGKNLIQFLFEIYQKNKGIENQEEDLSFSDDIDIPILSRSGAVVKQRLLYLGKEYEEDLCEYLFAYSNSKFVASPSELGLSNSPNDEIKEFLKWLGIEDKPRIIYKDLSSEEAKRFSQYLIQMIDFKNVKILGRSFKNIQEFSQELEWIGTFRVTDVDSIEDILSKADNEAVLYWLTKDEVLNGLLSTRNERDQSRMYIKFKGQYRSSIVKLINLPNYLSYKIGTKDWIKTKAGELSKPGACSISKTVDKSFSPYIEVPSINYKHDLFVKYRIPPKEVNKVLRAIGVVESFGDLSTTNLYGILNNLSKQENTKSIAKKAKAIYLEIAENGDPEFQPNKDVLNCKEYFENGVVYAKKGKHYEFVPIREPVYYVQDNVYSEDILKNFWCIEIPKRRSSFNIQKILGVEPLKNINFSVTNFNYHGLNKVLEIELNNLIPYIYGFRYKTDEKGFQLNRLKNSKIIFCSSITAKCIDGENSFNLGIKEYEFIEDSKTKTWYVSIPDRIKSIDLLKSTFKFNDAIAEIYSSILRVGAIRSNIRELLNLKQSERLEYFKSETDDVEGTLMTDVSLVLNRIDDFKDAFWNTIVVLKGQEFNHTEFKKDHTAYLTNTLGTNKIILDEFEQKFNYNIGQKSNEKEAIISLFKNLDINLREFNDKFELGIIDLTDYHRKRFDDLKFDYEGSVTEILYASLLNSSQEKQSEFLVLWDKYRSISTSFKNELEYDYLERLRKLANDKLSIDITSKFNDINPLAIFNNNREQLITKLKEESNFNEPLWDQLMESLSKRSLLYFNNFEYIIKSYLELVPVESSGAKNGVSKDFINVLDITGLTDDDNERLIIAEAKIESVNQTGKYSGGSSGGSFGISDEILNRTNEEVGARGEFLVYQALKKDPNNIVEWVSEIGRKYNINESPIGSDKHHYDIRWKRNGEVNWRYIEVKSSQGKISRIIITIDEVKFGEKNAEYYDVYFVENVFGHYNISVTYEFFNYEKDESFNDNLKFSVGVKQYSLGFKLN